MRIRNYAREHSQIARQARPLGEFIVDQLQARTPGPPRVPGVPKVGPKPKSKPPVHRVRAEREAPVLRACLKWLRSHGIFAWRNNTGTTWINGQPISFGYPGSGDILGLTPMGRFLAVECKSATGTQSAKQIKFQQKIEANGGLYLLVHSVEELEERWLPLHLSVSV